MNDRAPDRDIASVWSTLRRRKVVQWGLVYVAAAWGFLQGVEYVTETFHWPERVRQVSFLALLIGLPIALVLAWYHGDRGQQRVSTPEFAILTLPGWKSSATTSRTTRRSRAGTARASRTSSSRIGWRWRIRICGCGWVGRRLCQIAEARPNRYSRAGERRRESCTQVSHQERSKMRPMMGNASPSSATFTPRRGSNSCEPPPGPP